MCCDRSDADAAVVKVASIEAWLNLSREMGQCDNLIVPHARYGICTEVRLPSCMISRVGSFHALPEDSRGHDQDLATDGAA